MLSLIGKGVVREGLSTSMLAAATLTCCPTLLAFNSPHVCVRKYTSKPTGFMTPCYQQFCPTQHPFCVPVLTVVKVDTEGVFCDKISSRAPLGSTARLFTWLEPVGSTYWCTNWSFTLLPATAVPVGAGVGVVGPPADAATSRSRTRWFTGSPIYR